MAKDQDALFGAAKMLADSSRTLLDAANILNENDSKQIEVLEEILSAVKKPNQAKEKNADPIVQAIATSGLALNNAIVEAQKNIVYELKNQSKILKNISNIQQINPGNILDDSSIISSDISFIAKSAETIVEILKGEQINLKKETKPEADKINKITGLPNTTDLKELGEGMIKYAEGAIKIRDARKSIDYFLDMMSTLSSKIKEVDGEKLISLSKFLKSAGDSILSFGFKMTLATPLLKMSSASIAILPDITNKLQNAFENFDDNNLKKAEAFSSLGGSILKVSAYLALAAPFMLLAAPVAMLTPIVFGKLGDAFIGIGEKSETIDTGVKTAAWMGLAVLGVTGALALSASIVSLQMVSAIVVVSGGLGLLGYIFGKLGEASEPIMSGIKTATWMSLGILGFSGALALSTMMVGGDIANYALTTLITAGAIGLIGFTFAQIGIASDSIMKGAEVIAWMGLATLGFGAALALTTMAVGGNIANYALTALVTAGAIGLLAYTFALIGASEKQIERGAGVALWMGIGTLALGGALALTSFIVGGDIANYALTALVTAGAIGLLAFTFALVGGSKMKTEIIEGAITMAIAGLAVLAIGGALALYQEYGISLESALGVAAVIGALGLSLAVIGNLGTSAIAGAAALVVGGIGIAALALGLAAYEYFGITMETSLTTAGSVAVIVGALTLAGLASIPIALGAVALGVAGVAMLALGGGLAIMDLVYKKAVLGVLAPSSMDGNKTNLEYMIDSIVSAMSINPFMSVAMGLGAVALVGASVAMLTLSVGLLAMGAVLSGNTYNALFTAPDSNIAPEYGNTKLGAAMGAIVKAMSVNVFDSIAMGLGAVALVGASVALLTMSLGLLTFGSVLEKITPSLFSPGNNLAPEYGNTKMGDAMGTIVKAMSVNVLDSVAMFVGGIALVTASIALLTMSGGLLAFNFAHQKLNESGLFKISDNGKTPFENTMNAIIDGMVMGPMRLIGFYASIPAWLMAGASLITIGAGLSQFVQIVEKNIDVDKVGQSIASVLTAVSGAIVDVYERGVDWDEIEDGLDAFGEVGNVVMGLAEGVSKMAELKFPIYGEGGKITGYFGVNDGQFAKVSENIKLLMTTVGDALSEIGKTQGETGWFSKSDAERGRDVIMGIGGDLVGIVDFVQKAATLTFPIYDANGKQIGSKTLDPAMLEKGGAVYRNIVAMVRSVSDALAEIGSGEAAQSGWFSDSDIEKGKEAIRGVAGDIGGIAELVKSVATVENFADVENRIKRVIATIPEAIMAVSGFITQNQAVLEGTGKVITGLIWGPVNAVTEVLSRVVDKKITDKTGKDLGSSISSIISSFNGLSPDANTYNGLWTMSAFLDKMVASEPGVTKLSTSLEKINKSFSSFAATFKKMSNETLKNTDLLIKSLVDFSKVQPGGFKEVEEAARRFVEFAYERAEAVKLPDTSSSNNVANNVAPTSIGNFQATPAPTPIQPKGQTPSPNQAKDQAAKDQQYALLKQQVDAQAQQNAQMIMTLNQIKDLLSGTLKVRGI